MRKRNNINSFFKKSERCCIFAPLNCRAAQFPEIANVLDSALRLAIKATFAARHRKVNQ
jgi:hypothetical protein